MRRRFLLFLLALTILFTMVTPLLGLNASAAGTAMSSSAKGILFQQEMESAYGNSYTTRTKAETAVNNLLTNHSCGLTQPQFDALVDFVLEYGTSILSCGYRFENLIIAGNYTDTELASAFCSWVKSFGSFSQHKLDRRIRQLQLFLYGDYAGTSDPTFRYLVFDGNGGQSSDNLVVCYAVGQPYGELPTATLDGQYFSGWYTAPSGGTHVANSDTVVVNQKVYAHWSATSVSKPNDPFPTIALKTSETEIAVIKKREGFSPMPVPDYGHYSIGYGSYCDPADYPNGITEAEADYLLRKIIAEEVEPVLDRFLAKGTVQHTQNQYDALINFTYNLGPQWMNSKYNIYRYVLYGGYSEMELVNTFGAWCHAGGEVLPGLVRGRIDLANLYLNGDYTVRSTAYLGVIFDPQGGSCNTDVQYYKPKTIFGSLPTPTRSGYRFEGWYDKSGQKYTAADTVTFGGLLSLYAKWTAAGTACSHNYIHTVTAATCTTDGYTSHTCSKCGDAYVDAYVSAPGHSYESFIQEATCSEDGYSRQICRVCGYTLEDTVIPATGHTYFSTIIEPTCTERGFTLYFCSSCLTTRVDQMVSSLGHNMGQWVITREPTDTQPGERQRSCSRCDYVETEPIENTIHNMGDWTVTRQPTCTTEGRRTRTCVDCGYEESELIPALSHNMSSWVCMQDATCTEAGSYQRTCSRCGLVETSTTEALGHTWDAGVITTPPTLTAAGQRTYTCLRCGATRTEVIPAEGLPFTDVNPTDYFYQPVAWGYSNKIVTGVTDTRFAPDSLCTRAQIITFLWRAKGSPEPSLTRNPFKDVKESDYFYKAVLWSLEAGISDNNATFSPSTPCSRSQTVIFLYRASGSPAVHSDIRFSDVSPQDSYYNAVIWAVENGITNGVSSTRFSPDSTCTRAQIITFLYRWNNIS